MYFVLQKLVFVFEDHIGNKCGLILSNIILYYIICLFFICIKAVYFHVYYFYQIKSVDQKKRYLLHLHIYIYIYIYITRIIIYM